MYRSAAVEEAEKKWLEPVLEYATELFVNHWMPSHDIDHHMRVWRNAVDLAKILKSEDPYYYENLLLACFFHDLGLLYDKSERHGKKSQELCADFLCAHSELLTFDTHDLFQAIELHDDKEYTRQLADNLVYKVLCIADDLDAFGAMGAYRYIEIYLQRGMTEHKIPQAVLKNSESRFANIQDQLTNSFLKSSIHAKSFEVLQILFDERTFPESPLTLVKWIRDEVVSPRVNPFSFFKSFVKNIRTDNTRIAFFLENINSRDLG